MYGIHMAFNSEIRPCESRGILPFTKSTYIIATHIRVYTASCRVVLFYIPYFVSPARSQVISIFQLYLKWYLYVLLVGVLVHPKFLRLSLSSNLWKPTINQCVFMATQDPAGKYLDDARRRRKEQFNSHWCWGFWRVYYLDLLRYQQNDGNMELQCGAPQWCLLVYKPH